MRDTFISLSLRQNMKEKAQPALPLELRRTNLLILTFYQVKKASLSKEAFGVKNHGENKNPKDIGAVLVKQI